MAKTPFSVCLYEDDLIGSGGTLLEEYYAELSDEQLAVFKNDLRELVKRYADPKPA